MSLRTSYTGSLNTKLAEARAAGSTWVLTTNLATITTDMATAASKGQRKFTLTYAVTYQPADLRAKGPLWDAFKTGVIQAFASEDIMISEVSVELNTADQLDTKINLSFIL